MNQEQPSAMLIKRIFSKTTGLLALTIFLVYTFYKVVMLSLGTGTEIPTEILVGLVGFVNLALVFWFTVKEDIDTPVEQIDEDMIIREIESEPGIGEVTAADVPAADVPAADVPAGYVPAGYVPGR